MSQFLKINLFLIYTHILLGLFLWITLTNALAKREKREGGITCFLDVPNVPGGEVGRLLALDATGPEHQATLVADHEGVLAALALGLGRPPQQAAVAAPLQTRWTLGMEKPPNTAEPPRRPGPRIHSACTAMALWDLALSSELWQ